MARFSVALLLLACALAAQPPAEPTPDAQQIVLRSFERDKANDEIARQYTFLERVEERKLDKQSNVKSSESKTYDVLFLYGEAYQRLVAENGQPLSPKQEAKEQKKLDQAVQKRADETPKQREKRLQKKRKEEEERRRMNKEITRAFDFTLEGVESVDGVDCYRIRGEPKPGYEPGFRKARFLTKLRGVLWIAKTDYGWVRVETEVIDDVSFGLFLLKLKQGSAIELKQTRVNDEVWLLDTFHLRFNAKVAVLKTLRREVLVQWSEFRKFAVESKILTAAPETP